MPSLIGVYRHVAWLKHGDAATLDGAVEAAVDVFGEAPLSATDLALLPRYVAELVPRDFVVIASTPTRNERAAATDRPLRLTFSTPVFAAADNLARVTLRDAADQPVAALVSAEGRHVVVTPTSSLDHGASYTLVVAAGFSSHDERVAAAEIRVGFDTAAAPGLALAGDYRWVVDVPFPVFAAGQWLATTVM